MISARRKTMLLPFEKKMRKREGPFAGDDGLAELLFARGHHIGPDTGAHGAACDRSDRTADEPAAQHAHGAACRGAADSSLSLGTAEKSRGHGSQSDKASNPHRRSPSSATDCHRPQLNER
jgi:hypothetical protein